MDILLDWIPLIAPLINFINHKLPLIYLDALLMVRDLIKSQDTSRDTSRESSIITTRKRTNETKSSLHQMQNAVLLKQEKVQVIHDRKIASSSYSFVDVKMKMGG